MDSLKFIPLFNVHENNISINGLLACCIKEHVVYIIHINYIRSFEITCTLCKVSAKYLIMYHCSVNGVRRIIKFP